MAKPPCDDLAIGISMRRGCFLITPRVFNLLVSAYVCGRARAQSEQTAPHPTERMRSDFLSSVICDHVLPEVRNFLSFLGESSVHSNKG